MCFAASGRSGGRVSNCDDVAPSTTISHTAQSSHGPGDVAYGSPQYLFLTSPNPSFLVLKSGSSLGTEPTHSSFKRLNNYTDSSSTSLKQGIQCVYDSFFKKATSGHDRISLGLISFQVFLLLACLEKVFSFSDKDGHSK